MIQLVNYLKNKIMCLYPKLIKNKKYTKNKKNGGIIPTVSDNRVLYVTAACGKCFECRTKGKSMASKNVRRTKG